MILKDKCLAGLVVCIWGFNFLAIKTGVSQFPPIFATGLRFAIAAAFLLPFCGIKKKDLKGIFTISFVLGVGHFGLLFLGLKGIDAGTGSVIIQLGTPFSALLAAVIFKEKLTVNKIFGTVLAFGGILCIAGGASLTSYLHMGFVILSALFWATGNMIVKSFSQIDSVALNAGMALLAVPQLLLLSFFVESGQLEAVKHATWQGWLGLMYVSLFSSVIAYTIWYRLINHYDITKVVFYPMMAPVVALIAASLFLGESLTWEKILGAGLVMGGVALVEFRRF